MKIEQIDDVELISIKTKSLQDVDNEINFNLNINNLNKNDYAGKKSFNGKSHDKEYDVFTESVQEEDDLEEEEIDSDHCESSVRFLTIHKSPNGACGFHLTRTKWDPYPWVSAVDNFTPAAKTDLKAGDCVLEVNGCDVLGLRITEIAKLVKAAQHQITLLLWNSNCNAKCDKENLCAAPMPRSLQRLSLVVQTILNLIECPVCLDTITPPAMQCQNGHLLCVDCRIRAENCPVCRDRYFPRPALIAEQIQSVITSSFNLCRNEDKVRQKIFGRHNRQRQMVKTTLKYLQQKQQDKHQQVHKSLRANPLTEVEETNTTMTTKTSKTVTKINRKSERNVKDKFFKYTGNSNRTTCNKCLTKLSNSKAYSMGTLTNIQSKTATTTDNYFNTCHTTIKSPISQFELLDMKQQQTHQQHEQHSLHEQVGESRELLKDFAPGQQHLQKLSAINRNQFNYSTRNIARNQHYLLPYGNHLNDIKTDLNMNTKLCCKQILDNKMNHFSFASDKDLTRSKDSIACILDWPIILKRDQNKIPNLTMVCETSSALKLMDEHYKKPNL